MRIELVKPSYEMEGMMLEFVLEFIDYHEDTINGCCGLTRFSEYSEWIQYICQVENGLIADRVSSSTFIAIDKLSESIVGIIDIRHNLSEKHFYSGHIGYSVRPSLRGKGYGTEILKLGLKKIKEFNIDKVLLSCKKNNIASQKIIEKNNGILDKEIFEAGEAYLVYWISV